MYSNWISITYVQYKSDMQKLKILFVEKCIRQNVRFYYVLQIDFHNSFFPMLFIIIFVASTFSHSFAAITTITHRFLPFSFLHFTIFIFLYINIRIFILLLAWTAAFETRFSVSKFSLRRISKHISSLKNVYSHSSYI